MNHTNLQIAIVDVDDAARRNVGALVQGLGHRAHCDFSLPDFASNPRHDKIDAVIVNISDIADHDVNLVAIGASAHSCLAITTSWTFSMGLLDKLHRCRSFAHLIAPFSSDELLAAISVAVCRCEELNELRREAQAIRQSLEDRKCIERAKGIVMRLMCKDEENAYKHLQTLARQKRRPLVDVALSVIAIDALSMTHGGTS